MLFEEAIPDSAGERVALASIVGALHRCRIFPREPRATLVHKATGYSAKLLRKADQCRAVLACSHLHWQVGGLFSASAMCMASCHCHALLRWPVRHLCSQC
jgi:vacuolar protein sorting-associated protein 35